MPAMNVLMTGASGFVGTRLGALLRERGHTVLAVSRGAGAQVDWSEASLSSALARCDAVINLAGANVFGRRWNAAFKRELVESRVATTKRLALLAAQARTRVFVSASAVGYYGDSARIGLDEDAPRGSDFLAELCGDWESACAPAEAAGVRVQRLRIGLVIGRGGGALERLQRVFRLGVGGRLGSGRQWVSWIHLEDLCALFLRALEDESVRGVWNATAPNPVTNAELTSALAHTVHRPAIIPVPATLARLALGEAAYVLLGGQHVVPKCALAAGFQFRFPEIAGALDEALQQS